MQHTDTCIEVFKQDNTRIKSEKGLQILPCIIKETEVMYYVQHLTITGLKVLQILIFKNTNVHVLIPIQVSWSSNPILHFCTCILTVFKIPS